MEALLFPDLRRKNKYVHWRNMELNKNIKRNKHTHSCHLNKRVFAPADVSSDDVPLCARQNFIEIVAEIVTGHLHL